jgi:long-chain acyl-CoA synthetase
VNDPQTFADYVSDLERYGPNLALAKRSFLKVEKVTHHELRDRSRQVANFLIGRGLGPGERVMVIATNSPEWVELLLGALQVGVVIVPVDASSSQEIALRFIDEIGPRMIFTDGNLALNSSPDLEVHDLGELNQLIADAPCTAPGVLLDKEWPAVIVFTSGTTAAPKGVVLSQENILANIAGILERIEVGEDWRLLSVLPLSHMYEMSGSLAVLARGAGIFYMPRVTPSAIAESMVEYRISVMLAIPQLLTLMLERIRQVASEQGKSASFEKALDLAQHLPFGARRILFRSVHSQLGGRLRLVVTGGAPIPLDVATTWERMGVRMVQGYGLTETSPILTGNGLNGRRLDSPGRALYNVQLRIAEDGEIQAKGPSVFHGYLNNEQATREAFTDDGWFRTGDVGHLEDGWLHIQGRLKFVIVRSSGLKVFPEDVEIVADKSTLWRAICIAGKREHDGESVVAVVAGDAADPAVDEEIAKVNAQLESFQHIDSWRRWPEGDFPRTRLLKIDRRLVEDWVNAAEAPPGPTGTEEPSGGDVVLRALRQSLDNPGAAIKDTDRLADIGLDSLRRLTVLSLLEERLGVSIADDAVDAQTTVAQLRRLAGEGSPVEATRRPPRWPYWRAVRILGNGLRETVIRAMIRIWVNADVDGREHLADLDGPAIFIFNHSDDFDGPVVYHALPLGIRSHLAVATGADVMRDHKMLALLVRVCFAGFSFARSEPYMPSLEYVGTMLDGGWNVLVAPEGRISTDGRLQPFKSGIGLLAVNYGVPIVPMKTIGLAGTVPLHAKWPRKRSRVTVRIGQPLRFASDRDYEEVTATLHQVIEEM